MHLSVTQGDGAPLRTHLQRVRQATGRLDPMLAEAQQPLPVEVAVLWNTFTALRSSCEGAVSCTEIDAWCRLYRVQLTHWEVETLQILDRAARDAEAQAPTRKDLSQ